MSQNPERKLERAKFSEYKKYVPKYMRFKYPFKMWLGRKRKEG